LKGYYKWQANYLRLKSGSPLNIWLFLLEYLDWSCLTLGALGWGQIQIANSNILNIDIENTRKRWMLQLCDALDLFYPNEIAKITQRIGYFRNIREYWENQPD
jgi:hypothetical protein